MTPAAFERKGREGVETRDLGVVVLTCNLQVCVRQVQVHCIHRINIGSHPAPGPFACAQGRPNLLCAVPAHSEP